MPKSYRSRDKAGPYVARNYRLPLWAAVEIEFHARRETGGNRSRALELIIDDWRRTKEAIQKVRRDALDKARGD